MSHPLRRRKGQSGDTTTRAPTNRRHCAQRPKQGSPASGPALARRQSPSYQASTSGSAASTSNVVCPSRWRAPWQASSATPRKVGPNREVEQPVLGIRAAAGRPTSASCMACVTSFGPLCLSVASIAAVDLGGTQNGAPILDFPWARGYARLPVGPHNAGRGATRHFAVAHPPCGACRDGSKRSLATDVSSQAARAKTKCRLVVAPVVDVNPKAARVPRRRRLFWGDFRSDQRNNTHGATLPETPAEGKWAQGHVFRRGPAGPM